MAAGDSGRVLTSRDGSNWTNRSLPVTSSFTGVARHKGAWIVRSGTTLCALPTDGAVDELSLHRCAENSRGKSN